MCNRLKLDFHTHFTLLYRLWMMVASVVVILVIPYCFTQIEQGYYYTFSSFLAGQVLFELGTTFVITQITAHEIGQSNSSGELASILTSPSLIDRLAQLLIFSNQWLYFAAMLFIFIVGILGGYFFWVTGDLNPQQWLTPWILLVFANAGNMKLMANLSLLEGTGQMGEVAKLRLMQSMLGNIVMWSLLFCGAKLWALPSLPIITAMITIIWLKKHPLIQSLYTQRLRGISKSMQWKQDIFPMQWRIALSWASGYLVFQAIIPIVFAKLGSTAAGQLGLGLAVFNGVQSLGMSWMYVKIPRYAELIARGDRNTLNEMFSQALKQSISLISLGIGLVLAGLTGLTVFNWNIVHRFPPINAMICLGLITIANSLIFSVALYMRSHKEEPMLISSVVCGLLTLGGVYLGASYNQFTVTFVYMMITISIGVPWAFVLFKSYFYGQEQHA